MSTLPAAHYSAAPGWAGVYYTKVIAAAMAALEAAGFAGLGWVTPLAVQQMQTRILHSLEHIAPLWSAPLRE